MKLINVNVTDIKEESGYIEASGKEAAAKAINEAKISLAEQEKIGETGKASADREKDTQIAETYRDRDLKLTVTQKDREVSIAGACKNEAIGKAGQPGRSYRNFRSKFNGGERGERSQHHYC